MPQMAGLKQQEKKKGGEKNALLGFLPKWIGEDLTTICVPESGSHDIGKPKASREAQVGAIAHRGIGTRLGSWAPGRDGAELSREKVTSDSHVVCRCTRHGASSATRSISCPPVAGAMVYIYGIMVVESRVCSQQPAAGKESCVLR